LPLPGLRWLLPVMLVLGVWGMHTLGHLASHHSGTAASGPYALVHAEEPAEPAHGGTAPECHSELLRPMMSAEAFSGSSLGSGTSLRLDPTDVCLAVLASVLALLIAAMWAGARPWPGEMIARTLWVGGVARSPPRRMAPTLLGLSVMRT
jgi:hypothetical protein